MQTATLVTRGPIELGELIEDQFGERDLTWKNHLTHIHAALKLGLLRLKFFLLFVADDAGFNWFPTAKLVHLFDTVSIVWHLELNRFKS